MKPPYTYGSRFGVGQFVIVDGDADMKVRITHVRFDSSGPATPDYLVTWFHNGVQQSEWMPEWRLEVRL